MILDWWDTAAAQKAVEQFNSSRLADEAEGFRKALSLYATTQADEILARVEATAPDFISRSLQVMGFERFETVRQKLAAIAALKDFTNPQQGKEIRELISVDTTDGDLIQLTILLSIVWPLLVSKVEGDAVFVQKLGHTVDSWSKLNPKDRDVAYARWRKKNPVQQQR